MKLGNFKIFFLFIILFSTKSLFVFAEDKIKSVPLINLEDLSPTFEEDKSELEKPEVIAKIKANHAKNLEKIKKKAQSKVEENPFLKDENIEISENLSLDDVSSSCLICHK